MAQTALTTVILTHPTDYDRIIEIANADELVSLLALDETHDIAQQVEEYSVNGTIYSTLCPHSLEVEDTRRAIFRSTRDEITLAVG